MDNALGQAFADYKRNLGINFLPFGVEDGPIPTEKIEKKEEPKKEERKPEPRKTHRKEPQKEFRLDGRPIDAPICRAVADFLGMSPDAAAQDEKILGELVLMAADRVNSEDPYKILRFIKKSLRENQSGHFGKNPHRYLYRLWRM